MARRTKAEMEHTRQAIIAAARKVFHARGVHRTSLEEVAKAAGVTRGAVYWHFRNKTELFFAMRDQIALPFVDQADESEADLTGDPITAIEKALCGILEALRRQPALKHTHQILAFRCEYVGELEPVFDRIYRQSATPLWRFLLRRYAAAQAAGQLRSGLMPRTAATDTALFMQGLITRWLADDGGNATHRQALRSIRAHLLLRRA